MKKQIVCMLFNNGELINLLGLKFNLQVKLDHLTSRENCFQIHNGDSS